MWILSIFRYNPQLKDAGKNPFILDSKTPTEDFNEFLMGEVRFSSLKNVSQRNGCFI